VFGPSLFVRVDADAGGSGNIANEPSPSTVLIFSVSDMSNRTVSVLDGFTAVSFQYGAYTDFAVTVHAGLGGTGPVLASGAIPKTGLCEFDGIPRCGDPKGSFGIWWNYSLPFSGVAKSLAFADARVTIDDMVFVVAGPPTASPRAFPRQLRRRAPRRRTGCGTPRPTPRWASS
jgi:hypothetical protein